MTNPPADLPQADRIKEFFLFNLLNKLSEATTTIRQSSIFNRHSILVRQEDSALSILIRPSHKPRPSVDQFILQRVKSQESKTGLDYQRVNCYLKRLYFWKGIDKIN
jgi:hypothetical protein